MPANYSSNRSRAGENESGAEAMCANLCPGIAAGKPPHETPATVAMIGQRAKTSWMSVCPFWQ